MVPGTPRPPGHLHGHGRDVLDRAPDLFLFGPPPGRPLPVFVSGAELEDDPRFLSRNRLVRVARPAESAPANQCNRKRRRRVDRTRSSDRRRPENRILI